LVASAQLINIPFNNQTHYITYSITDKSSQGKDATFLISKDWATSAFKNYKEVIQVEDKDLGKIYLNGGIKTNGYPSDYLKYRVAIDCDQSSYRFILTDIRQVASNLKENEFEKLYVEYLENYQEIGRQKEKLTATTSKKEVKRIKEDIFNRESTHIILNRKVYEYNRAVLQVVDSYQKFMAAKAN
jgi:hypothetical protein